MNNSKFNIEINSIETGTIPILNTDKNEFYIFKKGKIVRLSNDKKPKKTSVKNNIIYSFFTKFKIFRRVLRLDITSLVFTKEDVLVAACRGSIIYKDKSKKEFNIAHKITRGSRPLNLCKHPGGNIYWGEYFSNPNRESVNIYGSENGKEWKIKYTFPPQKIRHIHGIYWDKFRNGLWVLTGDDDEESGLWFTDNEFKTLKCISSGSQKSRAVSIIPLKDKLIVPMDTPREVNYIQEFNIESNKFSKLKELPGSAFHCFSSNSLYLISTVVEPSEVNKAKYIEIFASEDCEKWISIAKLQQDFLSSLSYKFFRYPEVIFIDDQNENSEHIFMYCRGVKNFDNKMISLKKKKIIDFLNLDF